MVSVETQLGHLETVCDELELTYRPTYVFKLMCGCSVYSKDDVTSHTWDKCENQSSDFWCDRYMDTGRTTKHATRADEIKTIWGGAEIVRQDVERLLIRKTALEERMKFKNISEYAQILECHMPYTKPMSLIEEKTLRDAVTAWYLKEDIIPPLLETAHLLSISYFALKAVLAAFEADATLERLTLYGFGDEFI